MFRNMQMLFLHCYGNPSILSPRYFSGCYCAMLAGFGWEVDKGDFVEFLQFLAYLVVYNLFFLASLAIYHCFFLFAMSS